MHFSFPCSIRPCLAMRFPQQTKKFLQVLSIEYTMHQLLKLSQTMCVLVLLVYGQYTEKSPSAQWACPNQASTTSPNRRKQFHKTQRFPKARGVNHGGHRECHVTPTSGTWCAAHEAARRSIAGGEKMDIHLIGKNAP